MPVALSYPGVYIEEIPSGVRTVVGVPTSMTAFVGRALKGPVDDPVVIHDYGDYERIFGGLWLESPMSFAVEQYFLNGGTDAVIVRVARQALKANISLPPVGTNASIVLEASSPGKWGDALVAWVDHDVDPPDPANTGTLFNLTVRLGAQIETFRNVSSDLSHRRYLVNVLRDESKLVQTANNPVSATGAAANSGDVTSDAFWRSGNSGSDGVAVKDEDIIGKLSEKTGIHALIKADIFNLLCIPPLQFGAGTGRDIAGTTWAAAAKFCEDHRAMLIVDSPAGWSGKKPALSDIDGLMERRKNAAVYFPRVRMANGLREGRLEDFAPCGVVAGVIARTDAARGVWKAPAGIEATLAGVRELSYKLSDGEQGELNPLGVNCLRTFPVVGHVVWGARTLRGADKLTDEWKYLPVRRLALYIEETLFRGTQWVVFEPNDEPLWAQIRLNVGAFMNGLFRQGAFQGKSASEAYLVKCDRQTTTQDDVNRGIVNIVVGFAPLKPAEFVVIKISQLAGQIQT